MSLETRVHNTEEFIQTDHFGTGRRKTEEFPSEVPED
jgi:hypothetical protein